MNSQNSFIWLSFFLLNLAKLNLAGPVSSRTKPCNIHPNQIICLGESINDASLLMLKKELLERHHGMYFEQLMITGTHITLIGADVFADNEFESITISDNQFLRNIDERAFKAATKTASLQIINNRLLKSNTLYKLADQVKATVVDLDYNALEEVPSHAFNELVVPSSHPPTTTITTFSSNTPDLTSHTTATTTTTTTTSTTHTEIMHLQNVQIRDNQIRHISSNAFHLMNSVSEIALSSNQVEHIARAAFNLVNHAAEKRLKIKLDSNRLTAASFEEGFIQLNDATSLELDLSHNAIEALKETVFKPLLAKNIIIDLTGNPIVCHGADTAWLFKAENSQLLHKLKGVSC